MKLQNLKLVDFEINGSAAVVTLSADLGDPTQTLFATVTAPLALVLELLKGVKLPDFHLPFS